MMPGPCPLYPQKRTLTAIFWMSARSLTIHRDNKFGWIIECDPGWDDCATGLQITPLERAMDAVENENDALL